MMMCQVYPKAEEAWIDDAWYCVYNITYVLRCLISLQVQNSDGESCVFVEHLNHGGGAAF